MWSSKDLRPKPIRASNSRSTNFTENHLVAVHIPHCSREFCNPNRIESNKFKRSVTANFPIRYDDAVGIPLYFPLAEIKVNFAIIVFPTMPIVIAIGFHTNDKISTSLVSGCNFVVLDKSTPIDVQLPSFYSMSNSFCIWSNSLERQCFYDLLNDDARLLLTCYLADVLWSTCANINC